MTKQQWDALETVRTATQEAGRKYDTARWAYGTPQQARASQMYAQSLALITWAFILLGQASN